MPFANVERIRGLLSRAYATADMCPILSRFGILELGITRASKEWQFVRVKPQFTLLLVVVSGCAEVICGDRWCEIGPETAYLMPDNVPHGYTLANGSREWSYAWVRCEPCASIVTRIKSARTQTRRVPSYSLHAACRGLIT